MGLTECVLLRNRGLSAPNIDHMQTLHPWKFDVSTTPIGAHKTFGVSSTGLFLGFCQLCFTLKMPLEPHCRNFLLNEHSRYITSQR
jgi:hypothetical protein